jgi:hypothetical protein
MQEETYKQKLDIYYLATIGYWVTLVAYVTVSGTLIGDRFELVWKDPVVYLLAFFAVISLLALAFVVIADRTVIVRERELVFRTRFKERIFTPESIEWIGFRRETQVRGQAFPAARIKVRSRRRPLWLRTGAFEQSLHLARTLREWARTTGVEYRVGRRGRRGPGRRQSE